MLEVVPEREADTDRRAGLRRGHAKPQRIDFGWMPLPRKLLHMKTIEDHEIKKEEFDCLKLSNHLESHLDSSKATKSLIEHTHLRLNLSASYDNTAVWREAERSNVTGYR